MSKQLFKEVALSDITPNPYNPRKNFKGPKFDELVASVKTKGVIEPILLRKNPQGEGYELVAGERRWRASCKVAQNNGGLSGHTIPAMIRELSDDDAFDLLVIENLHRDDLTELEEAESFKLYIDKHGADSVPQLAERTGANQTYIRRRLAVLQLPKKALKAWDKGELKYGHLEQLCRLEDKKAVNKYLQDVCDYGHSVRRLKDWIDREAIKLKDAKFDVEKEGCLQCMKNTETQKSLLDIGDIKEASCLDPKCFKKKLNNYLQGNWKRTGYRKQHRTNGFRFDGEISFNDYNIFHKKEPKRCKECPHFVTFIYLDGRVSQGRVCIGEKHCFNQKKKETPAAAGATIEEDTPRQAPEWHGEYFREAFYREVLPERLGEFDCTDLKIQRLMLFSLLDSNNELRRWYGSKKRCGKKDNYWDCPNMDEIWEKISITPYLTIVEDLKEAAIEVTMQNQNLGGFAGSQMAKCRRGIADHIGISLQEEWRITDEYLQKKTKGEIFAIGEKFKIFEDEKAKTFLYEILLKKRGKFESCKKSELMRVFLESGVDLAGVVPEEILRD